MTTAQRNHQAALLKAAGFEDGAALTTTSTQGDIPHGRELSFAWLAGTVMTGLTSVLLMGAALFVSFQGQDTFSTPFEALLIAQQSIETDPSIGNEKTNRIKPVALTRSDKEIVEASIREQVDGRSMIRKQPFVRIKATMATAGTALSEGIPAYDPIALLNASRPLSAEDISQISTEIYGAEVDGEVAINTSPLSLAQIPLRRISDSTAASFARQIVEGGTLGDSESAYLSYAATSESVRDLGIVSSNLISGIAENVTILSKTSLPGETTTGRTERILTVRERSSLEDVLTKNGFTPVMIAAIGKTLRNVYPQTDLPQGARLRILFGPARNSSSIIPYRMSIYVQDKHAATVALTDRGRYVLALAPPQVEFADEDTEEINVNNLPTIYRSIWETGRKHDLANETIERIITLYAYDLDLNKRISAGDSIEILQTPPDAAGRQDLLYVAISLNQTKREFYRFRTDDGAVEFYDTNGQTGKRFLQRRPVKGGGNLRSRFGYRRHPVYKTYKLHNGIDLAAPYGTPIYASGDGVVKRAQWVSGYGRYVELIHVNSYGTGYGHMSRIADGMAPGTSVRQGQIIGYVGSTGVSTGNHLHFEIKINGRHVDPLSVKLPRDKTLPANYQRAFAQTVDQIQDLMSRNPAPVTVATAN